jgi:hypothetical protein
VSMSFIFTGLVYLLGAMAEAPLTVLRYFGFLALSWWFVTCAARALS